MADLTRIFAWDQTSIGPIARWPDVLLITVNILLASPHPMFLWWGPELLQFYNDAYRQCLRDDKHPRALGQKGAECWPEVWSTIGPQIEQVMLNGKTVWQENQLIPIFRDGCLEDVYWTYAYSPVRDLAGNIGGTLVICTETTKKQIAEQTLRQELNRLGDLFQQAPAFFTVLRGPQHMFERINPLYQQLLRAAQPHWQDSARGCAGSRGPGIHRDPGHGVSNRRAVHRSWYADTVGAARLGSSRPTLPGFCLSTHA